MLVLDIIHSKWIRTQMYYHVVDIVTHTHTYVLNRPNVFSLFNSFIYNAFIWSAIKIIAVINISTAATVTVTIAPLYITADSDSFFPVSINF